MHCLSVLGLVGAFPPEGERFATSKVNDLENSQNKNGGGGEEILCKYSASFG